MRQDQSAPLASLALLERSVQQELLALQEQLELLASLALLEQLEPLASLERSARQAQLAPQEFCRRAKSRSSCRITR